MWCSQLISCFLLGWLYRQRHRRIIFMLNKMLLLFGIPENPLSDFAGTVGKVVTNLHPISVPQERENLDATPKVGSK
jgi:hypothetical protein